MDLKKLECLLILILALLNLFLLAAVASEAVESRQATAQTASRLLEMLENRGISVESGVELVQSCPPQYEMVRSTEQEARWAQALLGEHSAEDQGGGILYYRSDSGQIVIRGTGEFDMMLTESLPRGSQSAERVTQLFSRAGLTLGELGVSADGRTLLFDCNCQGWPVFNAVLSFDLLAEQMTVASGTLPFSQVRSAHSEGCMDSVSALTRFAALTKDEGIIATRLTELTPGYYMRVTMSGESVMTPVWHIVTDTADIYLNAVTGQAENRPY